MARKPPELRDSWDESDEDPDSWLDIPEFADEEWRRDRFAFIGWPGAMFEDGDWQAMVREALQSIRWAAEEIFPTEADLWKACERYIARKDPWEPTDSEASFAHTYYDILWQVQQLPKHAKMGERNLVAALAALLSQVAALLLNGPDPDKALARVRTDQARRGAQGRIAKDPRSVAKTQAYAYWERWVEDGSLYVGKAEFAKDMLEKLPALTSQAVIERWCREWEAHTGRRPSPS